MDASPIAIAVAYVTLAIILGALAACAWTWIDERLRARRAARRAEIEAVLDRKERELRGAVFRLAEALAAERIVANRASREMVRAAYVARGELP